MRRLETNLGCKNGCKEPPRWNQIQACAAPGSSHLCEEHGVVRDPRRSRDMEPNGDRAEVSSLDEDSETVTSDLVSNLDARSDRFSDQKRHYLFIGSGPERLGPRAPSSTSRL